MVEVVIRVVAPRPGSPVPSTPERREGLRACAAAAAKSLQSCPTLCNPIDGSPPGFPVPGILQAPFSSCPQSFPASVSFPMSWLFISDGQNIGASASTSVLPMNTQDWSPLGWTGWISLQSKASGGSRGTSGTPCRQSMGVDPSVAIRRGEGVQSLWSLCAPLFVSTGSRVYRGSSEP